MQVRVRRPPSPQSAPLLSADEAEEEGLTKARASSAIRKGHMSCVSPASHPDQSVQLPSDGQLKAIGKASKPVFSHLVTNLTPDIQNACAYAICGSSGAAKRKGRREGADRDGGSGGVQGKKNGGVSHCRKAKLLPDLCIHPCSYPSRLLVFRSLSFHSFFPSFVVVFLCVFALHSSTFLTLLLWLLWQTVLLGGMAQGDNVCGEAVFEQDPSVSLTVQLSDEAIPVDHKAWTKPETADTEC